MPGKKTVAKPATAAKPAKPKKPAPAVARKVAHLVHAPSTQAPSSHGASSHGPSSHGKKAPITKPKSSPAAPSRKPAAGSSSAAASAPVPAAAPAPRAGAVKPASAPPAAAPARAQHRSIDTGPIATYVQRTPPMSTASAGDSDDGDDSSLLAGPRNVSPYIAKRGEQYMNKEQLEHFRQILMSWKRDLMEEVDRTVSHMKDEAANFPDPNDRATQEEEFSLELRTRDRERKLIRKIEEALKRIDDGSYGYCLETGEEIGIKRLEARPVATLSIEAQERRERREKQYGDRDDRYR